MAPRYAEQTKVPVEKTRAELDLLLQKHGASQRAIFADDLNGVACAAFVLSGRNIRVAMSLPSVEQVPDHTKVPRGWRYWSCDQRLEWCRQHHDQIVRSRWRGLVLLIRAKLEAIADSRSTVEREFLADVLLPNGQTVAQLVAGSIDEAYRTGEVPPLLPGSSYRALPPGRPE